MFFAKLHPLLVHFPMALLVSGTLFQLLGKLQREEALVDAGEFNVRFGLWAALPVIAVGVLGVLSLETKPEFESFLISHMLFAFLTVSLFGVLLVLHQFKERLWVNILYHLFLMLGLMSILTTGFYGGELVHRFGLPTSQTQITG